MSTRSRAKATGAAGAPAPRVVEASAREADPAPARRSSRRSAPANADDPPVRDSGARGNTNDHNNVTNLASALVGEVKLVIDDMFKPLKSQISSLQQTVELQGLRTRENYSPAIAQQAELAYRYKQLLERLMSGLNADDASEESLAAAREIEQLTALWLTSLLKIAPNMPNGLSVAAAYREEMFGKLGEAIDFESVNAEALTAAKERTAVRKSYARPAFPAQAAQQEIAYAVSQQQQGGSRKAKKAKKER